MMSGALLAALLILTSIPLYYGDASLQEMAEDTYRRFVPCLKEFGLEQSAIDKLKFPSDAEAHYQELLKATEKYRTGIPTHSNYDFTGPWIENHIIQKYKDKPLSYFRGLIPIFVQWVDIHVMSLNDTLKADSSSLKISQQTHGQIPQIMQRLLRPDVLYVTVTQDAQGLGKLTAAMPNIIALNSGGYGHVPLPLIKGEVPYQPYGDVEGSNKEGRTGWKTDIGFYGNPRPRLSRHGMLAEVKRMASEQNMKISIHPSVTWERDIGHTKLNLAPRGFGRTYSVILMFFLSFFLSCFLPFLVCGDLFVSLSLSLSLSISYCLPACCLPACLLACIL
jgi:hypothetical protein